MEVSCHYALERLYVDQDRDWVIDAVPAVLAWVPARTGKKAAPPFAFALSRRLGGPAAATEAVSLSWDVDALRTYDSAVAERAARLRDGRSVQREHVTELAAHGLALVAVSILLPGRRVVHMNLGTAPDLVLDLTPGAVRGVEVAGRSTGGRGALRRVADGAAATPRSPAVAGKVAQLRNRGDLAEVHLSLWCAAPRVAVFAQVKP